MKLGSLMISVSALLFTSEIAAAKCNYLELHRNLQFCRDDSGAKDRSKHILDASVDYDDPGLAIAGYLKCQEHQFCNIGDDRLKSRLQDMLGDLRDRTSRKSQLEAFVKKYLPVDEELYGIGESIAKLAGVSCKGKTGEPLRSLSSCNEQDVHLMYKYVAVGRDHTGAK